MRVAIAIVVAFVVLFFLLREYRQLWDGPIKARKARKAKRSRD